MSSPFLELQHSPISSPRRRRTLVLGHYIRIILVVLPVISLLLHCSSMLRKLDDEPNGVINLSHLDETATGAVSIQHQSSNASIDSSGSNSPDNAARVGLTEHNSTTRTSATLNATENATSIEPNAVVTENLPVVVEASTLARDAIITKIGDSIVEKHLNATAIVKSDKPARIVTLPALIADSVFMLDVIWVPPSQKIVLLTIAPKMFSHNKNQQYVWKSPAYNHTFPYEVLRSPITLLPQLTWNNHEIRACRNIQAEADDGNINDRMFIIECQVTKPEANSTSGVLRYNDSILAELDLSRGKFNAADGYQFDRECLSKSNNTANSNNTTKVSIVIKPISHYSPLIPDLMDYYQKQGVQHVYLGLIHPSNEMLDTFSRSLANFTGFVSLGWFDSNDVSFNYTNVSGHVLLKTMFANSALWNAKAFQDELLMVADLDDVLVSMDPTHTSFVEELGCRIDMKTTCDAVITPHVLWRPANLNSTRLGQRFPLRCSNTGIYEKSVAVLDNCDFVGIHYHKACRNSTSRKYVDPTKVTLHHYTTWWTGGRKRCSNPNELEVESELAIFQRHGFYKSTVQ